MSTTEQITVDGASRPSCVTPAEAGRALVVSYIEFIQDPLLRAVERLSAWLIWREQRADFRLEIDLATSLPVDLPMLAVAATEIDREWVVAMVADLTSFEVALHRHSNDLRFEFPRLDALTRPALLLLAQAELPRRLPSAAKKREVIDALLAHRFPRPTLTNTDLLELQQRDSDARHKASAIRRTLLLMTDGESLVVEGLAVKRCSACRFTIETNEAAPFAKLEDAVTYLRTAPPRWSADDELAHTDRAA